MDIKVKCRKCGRQAKPEEFILDPFYGMMVCPLCVKERKNKDRIHREIETMKNEKKEEDVKRPADYDSDDIYLEKAYKTKMMNTVKVDRVGEDKVRYTCPKCSYTFEYNTARNIPGRCPYCSAEIKKFRY